MQFAITFPAHSPLPLYKQISNALRDAIISGRLQHGDKLPSTRELSDSLKISRLTVSRGLEDLASQGYVQTVLGSGSYVSSSMIQQFDPSPAGNASSDAPAVPAPVPSLSSFARRVLNAENGENSENSKSIASGQNEDAEKTQFTEFGIAPAVDQLPMKRWREMLMKACRFDEEQPTLEPTDSFGYLPLRQAIAAYLSRARSINCDASRVVIFSSVGASTDFVMRLLSEAGDQIVMETPGSIHARDLAQAHGLNVLAVAVDEGGMKTPPFRETPDTLRFVYTNPSRNPVNGVAMSLKRRLELLDWSRANGVMIVEDDLDCEFRYGERLLPSIMSLDSNHCVIYRSSFFKALYPLTRFSFIVLPENLVPAARAMKNVLDYDIPVLEQKALTELIEGGHFERHIRRTQAIYARRRAAMILALTRHFKGRIAIAPQTSGLHLSIRLSTEFDVESLESAARSAGLVMRSVAHHYSDDGPYGEFIVAFALADEMQISASVAN
ncbi:MAG TPA: PLP-dependent aminotransferase family protein, partial [Chroococcales cyanobacterium]